MRVFHHPDEYTTKDRGTVVALGNFDGFHRGHQVVIGEAGRLAREMGLYLTVIVMEPHPVSFFAPNTPPFRLTPAEERIKLLETFGVDQLLILPFNKALASLPAQDFVHNILVKAVGAKHVCVGYDYRFGKGRGGGTDVLAWMGEMEGFGLSVIAPVTVEQEEYKAEVYSSTLIRKAIKAGEVRKAANLLGHWWAISGAVCKGDQRGRTIGFPTANIEPGDSLMPALGVYAVRVFINGAPEMYPGVTNIGKRPTFDKRDVLAEVHLFDFKGDLYGKHLRVQLVDYIRPEQKFDGLEALTKQIKIDSEHAKIVLADPKNQAACLTAPTLDKYLELP